ncbi:MAG TPA: hypothetical protein VMZ25_07155, partial [Terriglobales bacterium]|nr:hypothetical protein [Terriglobales bacterium]
APEPERLELTLARIRKVLGDLTGERVGSPQLLNTHQPDTFKMLHFSPGKETQSNAETRRRGENEAGKAGLRILPAPSNPTLSALRIFRPAISAQVETSRGVLTHLSFTSGALLGIRAEVIAAAGPWRASGNWWNPTPWARDEWDVALAVRQQKTTSVALYRIYRDLESGEWLVEGSYD